MSEHEEDRQAWCNASCRGYISYKSRRVDTLNQYSPTKTSYNYPQRLRCRWCHRSQPSWRFRSFTRALPNKTTSYQANVIVDKTPKEITINCLKFNPVSDSKSSLGKANKIHFPSHIFFLSRLPNLFNGSLFVWMTRSELCVQQICLPSNI